MNHLEKAHSYWKEVICPGDTVIDATCGNGHDISFLATLLQGKGRLIGYDIQELALEQTKVRLLTLSPDERAIVELKKASHEKLEKAKLIVYNLGYLPGGNKSITTQTETTLKSIKNALELAEFISITCYPGHEEGSREKEAILALLKNIEGWKIRYEPGRVQWAPFLIWLERSPSYNETHTQEVFVPVR